MKKIVLAAMSATALTSAASAADMAARMPMKAPPPMVAVYNWTGFYIGAAGGYGWSDRVSLGALAVSSDEIRGGFAGGTIGYNWQTPGSQFVFGLEADAFWSDMRYNETIGVVTFEDRIRSFGSVTGRLGLAVDAALFYVKGGFAWADNRISIAGPAAAFAESNIHTGWTVGGGAEWGFTPNWSAKVEYMYADYGNETYFSTLVPSGAALGAETHTVKVGINYRFGGRGF